MAKGSASLALMCFNILIIEKTLEGTHKATRERTRVLTISLLGCARRP